MPVGCHNQKIPTAAGHRIEWPAAVPADYLMVDSAAIIAEQRTLRLAHRIILGIVQGFEIGIVCCFQGGILFSFFQDFLILLLQNK